MTSEIKTCCVTGHRDIPAEKNERIKKELRREILQAIEDGYTRFISGFAVGCDLFFASIVAELKEENPDLKLEAAIPHRDRMKTPDELFHRLLGACDEVRVHSEKYKPNCFYNRNKYMVLNSQRIIAVYDGREKGGTVMTMRHAQSLGREVRVIKI